MDEREKFRLALESLNPTQRESVESDSNSLQILAGPGSGKTRVLTYRVAYLVIEKNIYPSNILVVTFTNKAATEMKTRLFDLIGESRTNRLLIGTFHSICSRILHRYASYAGLDPRFTICDPDQSKVIINKIQKDKKTNIDHFTRDKMAAGAILGIISKAKSIGENEHMYKELHGHEFKCKDIAVIFLAYEEELRRQNMLDYDNLLLKCCDLLRVKNDVLFRIKSILVDEYQDTNIVQYDLIKLMMKQKNKKTLTIVGDPDQSIFGWRSAEPKNFGNMLTDFQGTSSIKMEQNYRSTKMVIDSALHVIKQDVSRIDKLLFTDNPEGIPISLITTKDPQSQADFVAAEIKKAIVYSKGLIQYKDIAILMRMNFISQQFESTLRLSKIPFTMVGGDRFFDRVEVKDMTSYLLFAFNPKNVTTFTRIINVPRRGIGEVWLNRILDYNMNHNGTMLDSLREIGDGASNTKFPATMKSKIRDLVAICMHIREMIDEKKEVASVLSYIYEATQYEKYLKDHYFQDHESRWQNLGELLSIANKTNETSIHPNTHYDEDPDNMTIVDGDFGSMDFQIDSINEEMKSKTSGKLESGVKSEPSVKQESEQTVKAEPGEFDFEGFDFEDFHDDGFGPDSEEEPIYKADPVTEFLEYCSLCSNQKELEEAEGGKVTIATIHSAKGLEWPCVFIATCNDGVIPHSRCEDVEEEGRLLYVAMTRSKFLLYCISLKQRDVWGQLQTQNPSHFLAGMSKDLCIKKPPEWNRVMRTMLATTTNRTITEEDVNDELSIQKKKALLYSSQSNPSSSQSSPSDIRFGVNGNRTDLSMMGGFSSASSLFSACDKFTKSKKKGSAVKREVKEEPDNQKSKSQRLLYFHGG